MIKIYCTSFTSVGNNVVVVPPKITAAALSTAIKNADPYGLYYIIEERLNRALGKSEFSADEIKRMSPLFANQMTGYLLRYRHEPQNIFMVQDETESNAETESEGLAQSQTSLKVYSGRLERLTVLEILDAYRKGRLVEGSLIHRIFTKLVHRGTNVEAASICNKCKKIFASSSSARSSHNAHIKWHEENSEGDAVVPVSFKHLLVHCIADMISQDVAFFYH
uniref:C2H2-type domain-containing protein n=1 Tax=Panagrolaimus superbus TaxID=310955 RepID=A0A914XUB3_9BILA